MTVIELTRLLFGIYYVSVSAYEFNLPLCLISYSDIIQFLYFVLNSIYLYIMLKLYVKIGIDTVN